ncbi:Ig-like domain repeat protein, partial [Paenibacillus caseinilyticus]
MNRKYASYAAPVDPAAPRLVRWSMFCLWAVLLCLLVPDGSAQAATFTVKDTADTVDASPGDGVCADASGASGKCTLRAAIMESNTLPGADTINVDPGVYTLSRNGTDENGAATGDLDILGELVLTGSSGNAEGDPAATVIQAGTSAATGIDRVIDINPNLDLNVNVTVQALTVRNGRGMDEYGAGIAADSGSGTIRIYNSIVSGNTSLSGNGAGLYLSGGSPAGKLLVDKSRIVGNISYNRGGGVFVEGVAAFTMTGTTVEGNTATAGSGGGLFLIGDAQRTVSSSTIAGNTAKGTAGSSLDGLGGGIYSVSKLNLDNSTISGNVAVRDGGGLQLAYAVDGAYLIRNATIYGNTADSDNNATGSGGGIGIQAGTASPLIHNSIVAGNKLGSQAASDLFGSAAGGSSYNLIGTGGSGGLVNGTAGNKTGVSDLRLGALADNGGPTKTHALLAGSPALDAGTAAQAPGAADQRGTAFARTADAADADSAAVVDIGAFEAHPSIEDLPDASMGSGGTLPVTFHIGDAALGVDTVTAVSSDPQLIPNAAENLAVSGSGDTRTLTIKPAPGRSGTATITVTVSHQVGGAVRSMADTFQVTVTAQPDLAITKTHTGNFRKGQPGTYTITVTNVGSAPTSGGITVEDSLPAGLTFVSVEAASWSCQLGQEPTRCVSGQALAPGESFEPIVLKVNVQADAASTVTNRAVVSGGGDGNPANNTAEDSTIIEEMAAITTTSLTSSKTPSVYGESVTWTATVSVVAPDTGTPTGTVTFKDGATLLGTEVLNGSGTAVFSRPSLAVGSHSITAQYNGSANYQFSVSSAVVQTVNLGAAQVKVTALPTASVFGQPATFKAAVTAIAPASGTPAGEVTFKEGATELDTVTLDGTGVASLPVDTLAAGTHRITAVYKGSSSFAGSVSAGLDYTVERADTVVELNVSPVTSAVYGEKVTLKAGVTTAKPGGGTPAGNVIFMEGAKVLRTAVLDGSGAAYWKTSDLSVGSHTITAVYEGSANHKGSTDSANLQVDQAATSTSVSTSVYSRVYGEPVELTAEVTVNSPGRGLPGGKVTFRNGADVLGTGQLDEKGIAVWTAEAGFPVGTYAEITAEYAGDERYISSVSEALSELTVAKAATSTAVKSSPETAAVGDKVELTATVSITAPGKGTAGGNVTFKEGADVLGTVSVDDSGIAKLPTPALTQGEHTYTAEYSGDASFAGSVSSVVKVTADLRATSTSLKSSVKQSVYGEKFTLTAEVQSTGVTPTGEVVFLSGSTELGRRFLEADGTAEFVLTDLVPGIYDLTASYGGDGDHAGSVSAQGLSLTVDRAATSTSVSPSVSSAVYGENVTLTAQVLVTAPGGGQPIGTVSFQRDGQPLGDGILDAEGKAEIKVSFLPLGISGITAVYADSGNLFKGSSSNSVNVTVRNPGLELDRYTYNLRIGESQATVVTAVYGPGDRRNVTDQSVFSSSDASVATVDAEGKVTAVGYGTADITVTYGSEMAVARVTVPSTNTALKSLTLTVGMAVLVPGTDTYEATVGSGASSIGIQAEAENAGAMVSINGAAAAQGSASATADLSEGLNTFDITVTAPDGSEKRYILKITREHSVPSTNTALKSLTLTVGTAVLVPGTDTYEATVGSGASSIGIQAEAENAGAMVSINGAAAAQGSASATADLSEGLNTFDITVTAPDGSEKRYILKITREHSVPSTNTALKSLTLTVGTAVLVPGTDTYEATV